MMIGGSSSWWGGRRRPKALQAIVARRVRVNGALEGQRRRGRFSCGYFLAATGPLVPPCHDWTHPDVGGRPWKATPACAPATRSTISAGTFSPGRTGSGRQSCQPWATVMQWQQRLPATCRRRNGPRAFNACPHRIRGTGWGPSTMIQPCCRQPSPSSPKCCRPSTRQSCRSPAL